MNAESGSRPVGPSQPLALVLNRLEYSLTFAYRVKSKLLTGPIFGGAYNEYRFLFEHKLNQIDIPLLLSFSKRSGKIGFGGDFGIIKGLAIWGEVTPLIYEINQNDEVDVSQGFTDASGFVNPGDKFSLYFAPSLQINLSKMIDLEFQPFYRYQFGDKSNYEYNNEQGAPLSQYGVNLGIIKRF
ncbi:hypothetical protein Aoki45_00390 [Algoriphagus sp. oki45]|uniref:hypothetical protein n=1 Tax=Algoriphagus sp. oki45 TaxID=3067294 RepID=UPI0027F9B01B|nr:hypothetical protein Aoki45_00390 [Algoriphagus sp. oki45]